MHRRALWSVRHACLSGCGTLLSVYRALSNLHRALLSVRNALLILCLIYFAFRCIEELFEVYVRLVWADVVFFWVSTGLFRIYIGLNLTFLCFDHFAYRSIEELFDFQEIVSFFLNHDCEIALFPAQKQGIYNFLLLYFLLTDPSKGSPFSKRSYFFCF